MTIKEWLTSIQWIQYVLVPIVILLMFAVYIYGVLKFDNQFPKLRRGGVLFWRILGMIFGTLIVAYLVLNLFNIESKDWMLMSLTVGLVGITAFYAWRTADIAEATKQQAGATRQQAEASLQMAEEMREQRRPIIIPEIRTNFFSGTDFTDYFEINNVGNSPAIELEIIQLNKEKKLPQIIKGATFLLPTGQKSDEGYFPSGREPMEAYPVKLENNLDSTCYLLCQCRIVLSCSERQVWYRTWLPFTLVRSSDRDKIYIKPAGNINFDVAHHKEFF